MSKPYIKDTVVNMEFVKFARQVPMFHYFNIEGFKVGGEEPSSQFCLVKMDKPCEFHPKENEFIHVAWAALLFEENYRLKSELENNAR